MTERRSAALAATCLIALATIQPVHAQTGSNITASAGNQNSVTNATINASGASKTNSNTGERRYYRRKTRRHSVSRPLPSRGGIARADGPVVGRLAVITADTVQIRGGRDRDGRVLSVCNKGQYLAVTGEIGNQYGVLMADRSIGYINKSDVNLLDYQVVNQGQSLGERIVQQAQAYLGVPYVWGGESANGIDCSGLVKSVFSQFNISLPRHSGDQAAVGYDVPINNWQQWAPGDRLYFACHHPEIDHTAIYMGNGYFIHASASKGHQVNIDKINNAYYWRHLVAVRRSKELYEDSLSRSASSTSVPMANNTVSNSVSTSETNSAAPDPNTVNRQPDYSYQGTNSSSFNNRPDVEHRITTRTINSEYDPDANQQ